MSDECARLALKSFRVIPKRLVWTLVSSWKVYLPLIVSVNLHFHAKQSLMMRRKTVMRRFEAAACIAFPAAQPGLEVGSCKIA